MEQPKKLGRYLLALALIAALTIFSISRLLERNNGNGFTIPVTGPSDAPEPSNSLSSVDEQFERIDQVLNQAVQASIAYSIPPRVPLNKAVSVQLLLNPSASPTQLAGQITGDGEVVTATIEITPMMKAELIPEDPTALTIQPIHGDAVQLVGSMDTTKWEWLVTGRKGGPQKLLLVIHRLIKFEGQEYWREVQSYRAELNVQVTLAQRLQSLGWMWIAPLVLLAMAIPLLWRRYTAKRKQMARAKSSPSRSRSGHIFISYRRADSADITGRIYDRLVEEFGRSVIFKDVDSIPLGADFKEYLDRKVSECNVLLAVIGDRWFDGDAAGIKRLEDPQDFVRVEIESALERGIPVIPLLVRGAQIPEEQDLPAGLKKLVYQNGIQIRPDPDFHHDMDRLISGLDQYLG